ncbi:unnamed protein product [Darwinula stevensoni]|uniref:Ig-like domain-containing protein n=1 Tax=Darwinula stevensoni TaxID=69355 RepID=A0A7R9FPZ0_9CRUS|nr:unnamed protein product [Darwinula stevensoni]CAG0898316.1 unnamed protein product [Darwinula stevensoni]
MCRVLSVVLAACLASAARAPKKAEKPTKAVSKVEGRSFLLESGGFFDDDYYGGGYRRSYYRPYDDYYRGSYRLNDGYDYRYDDTYRNRYYGSRYPSNCRYGRDAQLRCEFPGQNIYGVSFSSLRSIASDVHVSRVSPSQRVEWWPVDDPRYNWQFRGRVSTYEYGGTATLEIRDVRPDDFGMYWCVADVTGYYGGYYGDYNGYNRYDSDNYRSGYGYDDYRPGYDDNRGLGRSYYPGRYQREGEATATRQSEHGGGGLRVAGGSDPAVRLLLSSCEHRGCCDSGAFMR